MTGRVLTAATMLAALAACGGGASTVVNPPSEHPTTSTPASPSSSGSPAPHDQHLTVTPAAGLRDRQSVLVVGRGFTPGEALVVTECGAKGKGTGAGDCNLAGLTSVTSDSNGVVKLRFVVLKGPFGSNNIVCGPKVHCLVSVTQATLSPTEEADADISFA